MKIRSLVIPSILATLCAIAAGEARKTLTPAAVDQKIAVFFSPDGGCTEAAVEAVGSARKTLNIQAYYFTSAPISKAVSEAKARGVKVTAILDESQETAKYSGATYLANAGITVYIDHEHAIAHNKIMLIDGKIILTGSFNFTSAAEKSNAENLLVIQDHPQLYAAYQKNFDAHLAHSKPYAGHDKPVDEKGSDKPTKGNGDEAAKPAGRNAAEIVCVTKSGKKYHAAGCAALGDSQLTMTLSEAKAKGLEPCGKCNPPQ